MTTLDLGYNQISRLDQLSSKLGNISKLSLAHNQITSLEGKFVKVTQYLSHGCYVGLRKMFSLMYLNLSQNSIVDVRM